MRRRSLSKSHSKRMFRRSSGVHKANDLNKRRMRGGMRW